MAAKVSKASPQKKIVTDGRKFEYILVKWQFENIQACVHSGQEHTTPVFRTSRDSECKWILKLKCEMSEVQPESISLYLSRCPSDRGPKKVPVSFRFGYQEDNNDIVWAPDDKQHSFVMKDTQTMTVPGIDKCFKNILSTTDITIYCVISALYSVRQKKSEAELQNYSDDILSIYKKERMPDLKLTCKEGTLKVHKSILSARSKVMEEMIKSPDEDGIRFPNINLSIMNDLLSFIYSGNWDVVFKDFVHTDVKEYAKMLDIPDLYEKFGSEEITAFNRNDYERVEYTWKIKNFPLLEEAENKKIYSPTFRSCSSDLTYIPIKMSAKIEKNDLVVEIYCSYAEIICEVSIVSAKGNKWFVYHEPDKDFEPGAPVEFRFDLNTISSKDPELYLPQNNLTIHCTVGFFRDNDKSVFKKEKCTRITDRFSKSGIEKLSKDMEALFKSRQYCDLSLATKKRKHKVHKVVLANRPSEIRAKVASLDPSVPSMIVRIPDRDMESLLLVAYTGRDLPEKSFM